MQSGGNKRSRNRYKRSKIQNVPKDPLEVILQVSNHKGVGGAKNNKRSDNRCNSGSRSTCCGESKGVTVATLGGNSASKLIFAVIRILAKTATSRRLSY